MNIRQLPVMQERRCFYTCLSRIEESYMKKDLREAELSALNLLSTIRELKKLQEDRKDRVVKSI